MIPTYPIIPSYDLDPGDDLGTPFRFDPLEKQPGSYDSSGPHRHNYHEIFYFVSGGGSHDIDFRTHSINDQSIHLVAPGQVHQVRRSPVSHGYVVLFTDEFHALGLGSSDVFHRLPASIAYRHPVLSVGAAEAEPVAEAFRALAGDATGEHPFRDALLRSHLNVLLLHIRALFDRESAREGGYAIDAGGAEILDRLATTVDERFLQVRSAGAYSELLHISLNHLNSLVRRTLGITATAFINRRVVLEAKRLLARSELPISEVAAARNGLSRARARWTPRRPGQAQSATAAGTRILNRYLIGSDSPHTLRPR